MTYPDLPNIDAELFAAPTADNVFESKPSTHPPRILLLYGSLRERSFSRLAVEEAARLLDADGDHYQSVIGAQGVYGIR